VIDNSISNIPTSIMKCQRDQEIHDFFLNLMDYKNNYFLSSDPKDIIHFYEGFESRDELIEWMKERPKGSCEIKEVEGEKDIIVVVPTTDFEGEYAKGCREEIFKGLHIIFVVSGKGNNYFNYAHNCNIGIKKALEYNPKWIVISNDDVFKVDDPSVLKNELMLIDSKTYGILLPRAFNYIYGHTFNINRYTFLYGIFGRLNVQKRDFYRIQRKFGLICGLVNHPSDFPNLFSKLKYIIFAHILTNNKVTIIPFPGYFFVINSNLFVENNELLDETFINAPEDVDLVLRKLLTGIRVTRIRYIIGALVGGSLGNGYDRQLRTISGDIYFFKKEQKSIGGSLCIKE